MFGKDLEAAEGSKERREEERKQESLLQNRNQRLEIQMRAKKGREERLEDEPERERNDHQGSRGNVDHSDRVLSRPDVRPP